MAVSAFNKMRFITRPEFHRTNFCPESRRLLGGYRGNSEFAVRIFMGARHIFSGYEPGANRYNYGSYHVAVCAFDKMHIHRHSGFHRTISCSDSGAFLKRILRRHKLQ